jgi:hypothetical protein
MNWAGGEIIPGVASNYVSIQWDGYLQPLFSEAYTFSTQANDGVRVYVNN